MLNWLCNAQCMLLAASVYCPTFIFVVMMKTVGFRYLTHKLEYFLELYPPCTC